MARIKFMDVIRYTAGFILARPKIESNKKGRTDYCTEGSFNVLFTRQAKPVPFKGLTLVSGSGGTSSAQASDGVGALTDKTP
jgi:hypothetical protein